MHYDTPSFLFLGYHSEQRSWVHLSALPCFACFAFLCFACFLGVSRFLVGIILILVKCFSFLVFRILYRIVWKNAMHPFICPFHLSIFRFYSLFLFSLLSYCYLYGTKLVKNDIFYENGLLLFHSSCLISNCFS